MATLSNDAIALSAAARRRLLTRLPRRPRVVLLKGYRRDRPLLSGMPVFCEASCARIAGAGAMSRRMRPVAVARSWTLASAIVRYHEQPATPSRRSLRASLNQPGRA